MKLFQIYTRLNHLFTALHWRGYAVHSPMMYHFVRKVVMPSSRRELPGRIVSLYAEGSVALFDNVAQFVESLEGACSSAPQAIEVAMILQPYVSRADRELMRRWYAENHAVVVHLQGLLVIFFDPKLQKQFYKIRN